ncbi:MAG: hypothetical protein ACHQT9_02665 [Candidatus Saccharimonadales bacterium]
MDQQIPNNQNPDNTEPIEPAPSSQTPPRPNYGSMDGMQPRPVQRPVSPGGLGSQPNARPIYRPVNRTFLTPQQPQSRPLQPDPNVQQPSQSPYQAPQAQPRPTPEPRPSETAAAQDDTGFQSNPLYYQQSHPAQPPQPIQPTPIPSPQPAPQYSTQPIPQPAVQSPVPTEHPAPTIAERKKAKPDGKVKSFVKTNRKHLGQAAAVLVFLVVGFQALSWYNLHYNSIYKKMAITTYDHKGVSFSFNYPAVLQNNKTIESQLDNTPLAYTYNISDQDVVMVNATYIPIHKPMQTLKLSTSDIITQLKANKGSYLNYLYNTYPGTYDGIFNNCKDFTPNSPGTFIICTYNGRVGTIAHIIGLDKNYQYGLNLFLPKSVYLVHQKIWDQVENSFSIQ